MGMPWASPTQSSLYHWALVQMVQHAHYHFHHPLLGSASPRPLEWLVAHHVLESLRPLAQQFHQWLPRARPMSQRSVAQLVCRPTAAGLAVRAERLVPEALVAPVVVEPEALVVAEPVVPTVAGLLAVAWPKAVPMAE